MCQKPTVGRAGAAVQPFLHRVRTWVRPGKSASAAGVHRWQLICWPGSEGWLYFDNQGNFNDWFEWLPARLRVGPWHPTAFAFIFLLYSSLIVLRPPLNYPPTAVQLFSTWWRVDLAVFAWCVMVITVSWRSYGGIYPYIISYTGWSWALLTIRAGAEAFGALL